MAYTAEQIAEGEKHTALSPEYFAARDAAERFLKHWQEEHAEQLAEAIMKPVLDAVQEKVWGAFRDWLLSDTEMNAQNEMRQIIEDSVTALIGGEEWAYRRYISPEGYRKEKVRETLAKLYSDPIKDARIRDLEIEVERLQEKLRFRTY